MLFDDYNFEKTPYDEWVSYGQAKSANALFAVGLTKRYAAEGVYSNAVMPGGIMTGSIKGIVKFTFTAFFWFHFADILLQQTHKKRVEHVEHHMLQMLHFLFSFFSSVYVLLFGFQKIPISMHWNPIKERKLNWKMKIRSGACDAPHAPIFFFVCLLKQYIGKVE